ncbi:MAG: cysteine desulfurase NifS [Deltaproteobacteria bacterium]
MKRIYLDHNATTPVHPAVADELCRSIRETFGNAGTLYSYGKEARMMVHDARELVASLIGAKREEIIFTSGGTESDNMAVRGAAYGNISKGKHIITSVFEHHAVLETCKALEKEGFEVSYVPVDEHGVVRLDELQKAIRPDTVIISIMHANNEVGTIQPIAEIGRIARERKVIFHTDAVQAFGKVKINVDEMDIDLLSASAHKLYGPKGIGALYIRKGIKIKPIMTGGHQERKLRPGTLNAPGIVGFGIAAKMAAIEMEGEGEKIKKLRDRLWDGIQAKIPHILRNGHQTQSLVNTLNVSFEFVEGESLILSLDDQGICVASGSACTSDSLEPSHVLLAMGLSPENAHGSLRFSLGRDNTEEEIDFVIETLPKVVERMRSMSPLYREFLKKQKKI